MLRTIQRLSFVLQLIMASHLASRKVRHRHHLHHHAGPTGEVLNSLTLACVRVILLESKARLLPLSEDVFDQVLTQVGIHFACLFPVGANLGCNVL